MKDTMLPCQREHFEIPREICFLNAASYSPLPRKTQEAGRAAIGRKGQPWKIPAGFANKLYERTRAAAARLINAETDDIALITQTALTLVTGDPKTMTGRIAHTQPFLREIGWLH